MDFTQTKGVPVQLRVLAHIAAPGDIAQGTPSTWALTSRPGQQQTVEVQIPGGMEFPVTLSIDIYSVEMGSERSWHQFLAVQARSDWREQASWHRQQFDLDASDRRRAELPRSPEDWEQEAGRQEELRSRLMSMLDGTETNAESLRDIHLRFGLASPLPFYLGEGEPDGLVDGESGGDVT